MKFSSTIMSNMTGRLGGIVFSHNTYGTYCRRYVMPVNPNTSGQQSQRNSLATVSQLWRSLNTDQQKAWTLAAPQHTVPNSVGGSLTLTGQALFLRTNILRQRLGLPILNDAPTSDDVPSITSPEIILNLDGSVTITFNDGDDWNASGGGILVSASPLLGNGVNFNSQYTDVGGVQFPGATPQALQLNYSTVAGGRVTFRFRATTPDGRLSDLFYADVTAPAQSVLLTLGVVDATNAVALFSRPVVAADFAAGDFTGAWRTTMVSVAQGSDAYRLALTGTGFAAAMAFAMTPSGTAADYVPPASGVTQ